MPDPSNGYESVAQEFMARRSEGRVGAATVRSWTRSLPAGAHVLDLGCGHGVPIAEVLMEQGCRIYGIDASATLIGAFTSRFPDAMVEQADVGDSRFFGRSFDGVVAWGLLFLLTPEAQGDLIQKVARHLRPGGHFLFTAPQEPCRWADLLTGRTSVSLGAAGYRTAIERAGLTPIGEDEDEGGNHYSFATRLRP